jgi:hypothetical protein
MTKTDREVELTIALILQAVHRRSERGRQLMHIDDALRSINPYPSLTPKSGLAGFPTCVTSPSSPDVRRQHFVRCAFLEVPMDPDGPLNVMSTPIWWKELGGSRYKGKQRPP